MAVNTAPAGYLICDGAAVGRTTYPELFAAIGTSYGEGDGETTFNLPNLIDKTAWGSTTTGQVKEAGLPNITGRFEYGAGLADTPYGCFYINELEPAIHDYVEGGSNRGDVYMDASRSSSVYGKSNTVQPPALTLLPCIKAFDAAVNPGTIDITELANEVAGKADKTQVANLAMPSQFSVELTIGDSGQNYTMPADGFLELIAIASGAGNVNFISQEKSSSLITRIWTKHNMILV